MLPVHVRKMLKSVCELLFAVHFLSPFRITTFHSTFRCRLLRIFLHVYATFNQTMLKFAFQISFKHRLSNCHVRSRLCALHPPLSVCIYIYIYVRLFSSSTFLAKKESQVSICRVKRKPGREASGEITSLLLKHQRLGSILWWRWNRHDRAGSLHTIVVP